MLRVLLFSLFVVLGIGSADAAVIYVDAAASSGGNGNTWSTAYKSLADGLARAGQTSGADSIYIMRGTYRPSSINGIPTFKIPANTSVYGGFTSRSQTSPGARTGNGSVVTLSGDTNRNGNYDSSDSPHVITIAGVSNVLVDRLTVTRGSANRSGHQTGAGLLISSSSGVAIQNVDVRSNRAASTGAGMSISDSDVYVGKDNNSVTGRFFSNIARNGGGIAVSGADTVLTLSGTVLRLNQADVSGGAIYARGGATVLNDDVRFPPRFEYNIAKNGGAIYATDSDIEFETPGGREMFFSNMALGGRGGAIYMNRVDCNLTGMEFSQNFASLDGGAVCLVNSTTRFEGSTIFDNWCNGSGGGIWGYGSTIILFRQGGYGTNIDNNSAGRYGGGLYLRSSSLLAERPSSISDNYAKLDGGGLYVTQTDRNVALYSQVRRNSAGRHGGAVYASYVDNLSAEATSFVENEAQGNGGAVFLNRSSFSLVGVNVSFSINAARALGNAVYGIRSILDDNAGINYGPDQDVVLY